MNINLLWARNMGVAYMLFLITSRIVGNIIHSGNGSFFLSMFLIGLNILTIVTLIFFQYGYCLLAKYLRDNFFKKMTYIYFVSFSFVMTLNTILPRFISSKHIVLSILSIILGILFLAFGFTLWKLYKIISYNSKYISAMYYISGLTMLLSGINNIIDFSMVKSLYNLYSVLLLVTIIIFPFLIVIFTNTLFMKYNNIEKD